MSRQSRLRPWLGFKYLIAVSLLFVACAELPFGSCGDTLETTQILVSNDTTTFAIETIEICAPRAVPAVNTDGEVEDPNVTEFTLYGFTFGIQPRSQSEAFDVRLWPNPPENFCCDGAEDCPAFVDVDADSAFHPQATCAPCADRYCVKAVAFVRYVSAVGVSGASNPPAVIPTDCSFEYDRYVAGQYQGEEGLTMLPNQPDFDNQPDAEPVFFQLESNRLNEIDVSSLGAQ